MPGDRVLVATDFSRPALEAARFTRDLVGRDAAYLLVHVHPPPPAFPLARLAPGDFTARAEEAVLREVERRLAEFAREADLADAERRVLTGRVAERVHAAALDFRASLVAVGARGMTPLERVLLGSRARAILRHAGTDVLVCRDVPRDVGRVAVATDFFAPAAHAAKRTCEIADRTGAEVWAFHSVDPTPWGSALSLPVGTTGGPAEEHVGRPQLVAAMSEKLHAFNEESLAGRARETVAYGDPVEEILAFVERGEIDLLVLGSHGPGALERFMLGSVAESVAERATCPVLVARQPSVE